MYGISSDLRFQEVPPKGTKASTVQSKHPSLPSNPQTAGSARLVGQMRQKEMRIWCQARLSKVIKALARLMANQLQLHFPRGVMTRFFWGGETKVLRIEDKEEEGKDLI